MQKTFTMKPQSMQRGARHTSSGVELRRAILKHNSNHLIAGSN